MINLAILIPVALFLGVVGLAAFLWSLRSGQYDDLDGAAERILHDDEEKPVEDERGGDGGPQS
ncbi:MAG: cbb3-type cytochrome oxidase assembly protein CcoS [Nitratireductor sp.]